MSDKVTSSPVLRLLSIIVAGGVIAFGSLYAFASIHQANLLRNADAEAAMPSPEEFRAAFDRAVDWSVENNRQLFNENQVWLWWFMKQAADVSGDPRLVDLTDYYVDRIRKQGTPTDLYRLLFLPDPELDQTLDIRDIQMEYMDHYGHALVYSRLCGEDFRNSDYIAPQLEPDYCDAELARDIRSRCLTHQMMSLYFIQGSACSYEPEIDTLMKNLQIQSRTHLILDPRVGDTYLQRVMTLLMTGRADMVKPIWFRRIIDAQQDDGGWLPYQSLYRLGPDIHIGMGLNGPRLKFEGPIFHSTAQGLYVMAMMLTPEQDKEVADNAN